MALWMGAIQNLRRLSLFCTDRRKKSPVVAPMYLVLLRRKSPVKNLLKDELVEVSVFRIYSVPPQEKD